MSLLADDICRNCYHVHETVPCNQIAEDPGPDDEPVYSVCRCMDYVDLEAEGRIMVLVPSKRGKGKEE